MRIGDAYEVLTPGDSRHRYATSWRHEAAKAVKDTQDRTSKIVADDATYLQLLYLEYIEDEDVHDAMCDLAYDHTVDSPLMTVHNANCLYSSSSDSCTKARIDALLLCPDLTYSDIARAYNQDEKTIKMYERLFFNVRDAEGKLLQSKGLLEYFAGQGMPTLTDPTDYTTHWRMVAFESGHGALLNMWGWPPGDIVPTFTDFESSSYLLRLAFSYVEKALRTGRGLDAKAYSAIFGDLNQRFSEYREKGMLSGTEALSEEHIILQLLELMQPERLMPTEERKDAHSQALEGRLSSLRSTAGTTEEATNLDFIESQLEKK